MLKGINLFLLLFLLTAFIYAQDETTETDDSISVNFDSPAPLTLIQNARHKMHQLLKKNEIDEAKKLLSLQLLKIQITYIIKN